MSDYAQYSEARKAIIDLIKSKEDDINDIEKDITNLKQTKKMIDNEFNISLTRRNEYAN